MPRAPRRMRLTEQHVALLRREIPDPGPQPAAGFRLAGDADFDSEVATILATRPPGSMWLFGYGSLIWRPETAFEEKRTAVARGWRRRFCLGWDHRFRGNPEEPGLMLALDRGGQCKGVVFRLPEVGLEAELHKLMRREMSMVPSAFPWRWIAVATVEGEVTALTFAMNRKSGRYVADLSDEQMVDMLATARGFRGSMAEYLFATVSMLESLGIHDRYLWRLQAEVADRIETVHAMEH